jgi:hypothetical protein
MSRLVSKADGPELERFSRRFLAKYLAHGFQSLSKRDVELLLFYELELSDLISASASNHDVAKMLRLTGRKVAGLRRDAMGALGRGQRNQRAPARQPEATIVRRGAEYRACGKPPRVE